MNALRISSFKTRRSFRECMRATASKTAEILHLPRRADHDAHRPLTMFGGGGGSPDVDAEILALGREFDDVLEAMARFRAERFLVALWRRSALKPERP